MKLLRFLIGLALLVLALVAFKFATDPFASMEAEAIAITLGQASGFVFCGLILGLIIWAPSRFFRGVEKFPDRWEFALYTAALCVAVFIVFRFFVGTPLSKSERLVFASGAEKTCFSTQRSHEENSTFNDSQLREYCSCFVSSFSGKVTKEEIKYRIDHGTLPGSIQEKSQQVGEQCSQELVRKRQGRNL